MAMRILLQAFNNIIISFTNKNGQVISWTAPVKWDSRVLKRILLMLHRWLLPMLRKLLWMQV